MKNNIYRVMNRLIKLWGHSFWKLLLLCLCIRRTPYFKVLSTEKKCGLCTVNYGILQKSCSSWQIPSNDCIIWWTLISAYVIPSWTTRFWHVDQQRQALLHSNTSGGVREVEVFDQTSIRFIPTSNTVTSTHTKHRRTIIPTLARLQIKQDINIVNDGHHFDKLITTAKICWVSLVS